MKKVIWKKNIQRFNKNMKKNVKKMMIYMMKTKIQKKRKKNIIIL